MGHEKLDSENAAVLIQKLWRGKQARKKYGFKQASETDLTDYPTFAVGNDPKIQGLEPYATPTGKIALVATSGLRSLELICKLGNKENTPKLIIVDNSKKVISFWRKLRELVEHSHFTDKNSFYQAFETFLSDNRHLYRNLADDAMSSSSTGPQYENQNPLKYMENLIDTHGLDYVLSVIKGSVIIAQSWENKQLFTALKNIIEFNEIEKVYAYPSNIEYCVLPWESLDVKANIELLNPDLTIATDFCPHHHIPEQVFLRPKTPKPAQVNKSQLSNGIQPSTDDAPEIGNLSQNQKQEEDKENAVLLQIQETLTQKIELLRSDSNHNENVLGIAERLNLQLVYVISTYINNKSNPAITKEQATTLFIDTITSAINGVKTLLEKELGWGDFLTNLLKSLANAVISAANAIGRFFGAQSQLTLFTPTKAPFISEVEQIEQDIKGAILSFA